jgi:hypothetical protein
MTSSQAERELVAEIRAAFASMPLPAAADLVPATGTPDREREQIRRDFAGRHWADLGIDFLAFRADSLLLLSAEGFHYYLPAYLIAAVEAPVESDLVTMAVFAGLAPASADDAVQSAWVDERVRLLSTAQKVAVRRWLEYMAADRPAEFPRGEKGRRLTEFWTRDNSR